MKPLPRRGVPVTSSLGTGRTIGEIARGFLKSLRIKRDVPLLSYFFQIVRGIPFTGGARGTAAPAQTTRGGASPPRYASHHGHSAVFPSRFFHTFRLRRQHVTAIQNLLPAAFGVSTREPATLSLTPGVPFSRPGSLSYDER